MSENNNASRNPAGGTKIKILLEIKSTQNDMTGLGFFSEAAEKKDPEELLIDAGEAVGGEYVFKTEGEMEIADRVTLSYAETELSGLEGSTTYISFAKDEPGIVTITRVSPGLRSMSFVIEAGRRNYSVYETPYGAIDMCTYTRLVENSVAEDGGEIRMVYSVELKGLTAQRTKMHVKVRVLD